MEWAMMLTRSASISFTARASSSARSLMEESGETRKTWTSAPRPRSRSGTPHRGTPLADAGSDVLGDKLRLRGLLEKLGLDVDAIYDLTTTHMKAFNDEVADARGVHYGSYAARTQGRSLVLSPLLLPTYLYLSDRVGENDGLVPTASQPWGELLGRVDADHWAQIGWSATFDAPAFYAGLIKELTARGL